MKKSGKFMLMILSLALVLSVTASVFTACNDNNGSSKNQYSVSVSDYDTNKGTVTVDKSNVDEGDEVTVSITSKDGFEIKSFYVGTNDVTQDLFTKNGLAAKNDYTTATYAFKVYKDYTVRAEFQEAGVNGNNSLVLSLGFDYDYGRGQITVDPDRGKFAIGESVTLKIVLNSNFLLSSLAVNGVEHVSEAKEGENAYTYNYTFTINENTTVKIDMAYNIRVIEDVKPEKFNEAINSNEWVLVDFWSHDCGYCVDVLGPSLKALCRDNKIGNVRVVKLELDSLNDRSSEAYKIKKRYEVQFKYNSDVGMPFVVLFKNGTPKACNVGAFATSATASETPTIEWLKKQGVQI